MARSRARVWLLVVSIGALLIVTPELREVAGRWEQMQLAARRDTRTLSYLNGLRAAYAVPVTREGIAADRVTKWPPPAGTIDGARIRIPEIGLDQAVLPDVTDDALRVGPGHYPGTALPGGPGTMVISGHRSTYTMPFRDLGLLEAGDEIYVESPGWTYRYRVQEVLVVAPTDLDPVRSGGGRRLVLTTCHPLGSATQRLVVTAGLVPAFGLSGGASMPSTAQLFNDAISEG